MAIALHVNMLLFDEAVTANDAQTPEPTERAAPAERWFGEPFARVVAAIDFSGRARQVLERAALLPLAPHARLHLVHVLPDGLPSQQASELSARARSELERVQKRVEAAAGVQGHHHLELSHEIRVGSAHVEIIRAMRAVDAELVLVGRHGVRPLRDAFLSTTASRLIRHGDVPVLEVQRRARKPYQRPLVATDLGDTSARTLRLALRLTGATAATIDLLHSYHVPFEGFLSPGRSAGGGDFELEYRRQALAGLGKLMTSFEALPVGLRPALRRGEPAWQILQELAHRRSDLVVLGTHGRSGIAHALVGSVAECVVAAAPCDVLIARPTRFSFEMP